jgi:hypothetical protein
LEKLLEINTAAYNAAVEINNIISTGVFQTPPLDICCALNNIGIAGGSANFISKNSWRLFQS